MRAAAIKSQPNRRRMLSALTERSDETGVAPALETSARILASAVIVLLGWAGRVKSRRRSASDEQAGSP